MSASLLIPLYLFVWDVICDCVEEEGRGSLDSALDISSEAKMLSITASARVMLVCAAVESRRVL